MTALTDRLQSERRARDEVIEALKPLDVETRRRVLGAAMVLLGLADWSVRP